MNIWVNKSSVQTSERNCCFFFQTGFLCDLSVIPPRVLSLLTLCFFLLPFFLLVKDSRLSVSEQNSANWFLRFIPLFLKLPHLGREEELPCRLKLQATLSYSLLSDPLAQHLMRLHTDISLNVQEKNKGNNPEQDSSCIFYLCLSQIPLLATFQSCFRGSVKHFT